ncbi:hypothetical protein DYU11_30965 [Fibrisoma montanum]|uniref:Uncharacterized protein n=2 Tax=Fibrisoma montanum TaxID=2305895 RepID=A0A418LWP9_9BACT|nr:hypothetical protein DYU11_30965 [Fibrisoma montanum]
MAGKQTSLRKEMGYVVIQNRDIRGGWKCWLTWANDAAFVLEQYYDFKEKNNPQKLKLARVNDVLLKQIEADRGKRYIMVEYQ